MESELQHRIAELEAAIRAHRDRRADDRCWLDDLELYAVLGDNVPPDNSVGDKLAMLENCKRFIAVRCSAGTWKSYVELESEVRSLRDQIALLQKFAVAAQRGSMSSDSPKSRSEERRVGKECRSRWSS